MGSFIVTVLNKMLVNVMRTAAFSIRAFSSAIVFILLLAPGDLLRLLPGKGRRDRIRRASICHEPSRG
jgi:hypothetical protein